MPDADRADRFAHDGYVGLPGLLDQDAVARLTAAGSKPPRSTTRDTTRCRSGPCASPQPVPGQRGDPRVPAVADGDRAGDRAAGPDTWIRWDQAVWKRPGAPEFPMHQDNGYSGLAEPHLQLWVALTPMAAGQQVAA